MAGWGKTEPDVYVTTSRLDGHPMLMARECAGSADACCPGSRPEVLRSRIDAVGHRDALVGLGP